MKKSKIVFCLLIFSAVNSFFGQSKTVSDANRRTAERCLKLAENNVLNNEWKSAYNQAEMGLAYDDSVSDLIYIKAAAQNKLDYKRADVLATISLAFEKDNWINYNRNNARILYADLLCDTGDYEKSLAVINENPLVYSADAELIRIKNNYRRGDKDSIAEARRKLDMARKVYPMDIRFPSLFFMFESLYLTTAENYGISYEIPENVKRIAGEYIKRMPNYKTKDVEMEIMASLFAEGEVQTRLLKAIGEKNNFRPLYAYAALKAGVISEEKAFNLFFDSSDGFYYLNILEAFTNLITDEELKQNLVKHLDSFSGTLAIDEDLDLINELVVKYDRGRPQYISFDENNDEVLEIYCSCDYGTPLSLSFPSSGFDMQYELYPCVLRATHNQDRIVYYFLPDEFMYSPFEMTVETSFSKIGSDFIVPYSSKENSVPTKTTLMQNAGRMDVQTAERQNSVARYIIVDGAVQKVEFYDNNIMYAYMIVYQGLPAVRYADYDGDDIFETAETYNYTDTPENYVSLDDAKLLLNIFGNIPLTDGIYLQKVEIDRNSDTIIEFREQFLEKGGKISSWDTDGNGVIDYEYVKYPGEEGAPLIEENIFYNESGIEQLSVIHHDGIPLFMKAGKKELPVLKGNADGFFWIGKKGSPEQETAVKAFIGNGLNIGVVKVLQYKNTRFSVIRIDQNYFCRELPGSETELKVMTQEYSDEK